MSGARDVSEEMIRRYERGELTRRELAARLLGIGAALAALPGSARGEEDNEPTFRAVGLDHIALDVTDLARSREFYARHLGLKIIRQDDRSCFMGGDGFFLALFRAERPRMNHYCYAVPGYDADAAEEKLRAAGLNPRRTQDRLYFDDPDGLEVQIAGA